MEYLDVILRSAVIYIFIIIAIRIFGKREISQLSIFDLVFILLLSNAVQNAMVGEQTTLLSGILAAGTLFAVNKILSSITYRSPKVNKWLEGSPLMLIYHGKILKKHLQQAMLPEEELEQAIREHGVRDASDVDLAVLETDGNISILSKDFQTRTIHKRRPHKVVSKID